MFNKILTLHISNKLLVDELADLHTEGNYKINQSDNSEEMIARLASISPDLLIINAAIPQEEQNKIIRTKELVSQFTDILIIEDKALTPIVADISEWRNNKLKSLGYLSDNPFG